MIIPVAWSFAARTVDERELDLPEASTVADALAALSTQVPPAVWQALSANATWSIWGRRVRGDQALSPGDRLEWTRPLRVDPKVARQERFARQGMRKAGLFTHKARAAQPPTEPRSAED